MPPDRGGESEYMHEATHSGHARAHAHAHGHEHVGHFGLVERRHYNGKAIASFVLGLGGFLLPIIPSILAIVFGHAARDDLRRDLTERGDGLALTGLILGYVGLGLALVLLGAAVLIL